MKIRKLLSAFLAMLMATTSMSVVAFAQDAEATALDPIQIRITSAGSDQRCTKKDDAKDSMGRTVQQMIPMESNYNIAPAWFSTSDERTAQINANYGYRVVKFVYYTSGSSNKTPTLSTWAFVNGNMAGRGAATVLEAPAAQAGKWNTAYFQIPDTIATDPFHAFMFGMYGGDSASSHINDTIYIGYIGLFDTYENAKTHKSDFEGDLALTAINVDGTAISSFNAATTTYTVDLAGKDYVPEVTVTGTGDANNLKVETSAYDTANGTATATVTADDAVYTINFTGGAVETGLEPKELQWNYNGNDNHGSNMASVTDEFGRTHISQVPRATSNNPIYPGGSLSDVGSYKVLKLVYKTSESKIPTLSVNFGKGTSTVSYDVTPEANKWNTVYYVIGDTANDTLATYQVNFSTKTGAQCTDADYYYIGYAAAFGSIVDAKAHTSIFEGDLSVTSVKMGGTEIATAAGTYAYDAQGAATVLELTISATGNTNGVVITNGEFDINGNATSTVKNGDDTIVTVNITGGEPKEIEPLTMNFEWTGEKEQGVAGVEEITDEFTRTYKRYAPALTYFEGGSDLVPTIEVSPGGSVTDFLPDGMATTDYKVAKIVVRSNEDYAPRLRHYGGKSGYVDALNAADFVANEWCVLYYEVTGLTMYQLAFTPDASPNHPAGEYDISYAALFGNLSAAQAHKSAFEGEFTITDVRLDGTSVGNVTTYDKDLAGAGAVPKLTVVATGDAEGVSITNGLIDAEGKATSTVTKDGEALVTINFTGADTTFKIVDIQVDGKSVENFDSATTEYTFNLGFAALKPVITYTYQGIEETVTIDIVDTTENNVTSKYVATLKSGETTLYTLTFNVDTTKPEILLNTLYKLNTEKKLTVAYLGGSVTSGTGSSSSNTKSWRAITRDWFKSTFRKLQSPKLTVLSAVPVQYSAYSEIRSRFLILLQVLPTFSLWKPLSTTATTAHTMITPT